MDCSCLSRRLRREWNSPRPTERLREHRKHAQVGVERDPFETADAEQTKSVLGGVRSP
jgi:hypothetical protein